MGLRGGRREALARPLQRAGSPWWPRACGSSGWSGEFSANLQCVMLELLAASLTPAFKTNVAALCASVPLPVLTLRQVPAGSPG